MSASTLTVEGATMSGEGSKLINVKLLEIIQIHPVNLMLFHVKGNSTLA